MELEFMISLSEARPNMVRKVSGWTEKIVEYVRFHISLMKKKHRY
jgi:hypothetical protein